MTSDDVLLRRADDCDARRAADVWLRSFAAALPAVRCAHDEADVRDWFARVLVPQYETWVAVTGDSVVGLMVLGGGELKQLYLDHEPIPLDDDQAARTARGRTAAERAAEEIPQQSVPRAESGSATARRNLGAGPGAR